MSAVAGIFVGGQARRMGGRSKGNLPTTEGGRAGQPGVTIVQKLRAACEAAGMRVLLVGNAAAREAYAAEGLLGVDDDRRAEGPLAGLVALLSNATEGKAVALACDMPFVDEAILKRLLEDPSEAPALAAKKGDTWEPFLARYDAKKMLPLALQAAHAGKLGLQSLLDEAGAAPFTMSPEEEKALIDWDKPTDIPPKT
jgi:molybdopterin-guanine dinucleotide biosynthesis protein A